MALQAHEVALREYENTNRPEDVEAYRANYEVFKKVLEHMSPDRYTGPEIAARALASNFDSKSMRGARILDVAAGTGRLGAELHRLGFRNLDALDPSPGMLCKAQMRNIYSKFYCEFLDAVNQTSIPDNTYDGLAVAGGMGEGHIPSDAIKEMIRIVKPGGFICIAMREEYLDHCSEYRDSLIPLMDRLEKEGKWTSLSREKIDNFALGKTGLLFQFKVT